MKPVFVEVTEEEGTLLTINLSSIYGFYEFKTGSINAYIETTFRGYKVQESYEEVKRRIDAAIEEAY